MTILIRTQSFNWTSVTKTARWAALPTLLMALLNVPAGPSTSVTDTPAAIDWTCAAIGLCGLVAGIALIRRASWARPAVAAIGAVNIGLAIAAISQDWDGGPIGLVISLVALVLVAVPGRMSRNIGAHTAAA